MFRANIVFHFFSGSIMCSGLCWNVSGFGQHITAAAAKPVLQRLAQWQAKNVSQLTLTLGPHYSPAATAYPLIRMVWPVTFGEDFNLVASQFKEPKQDQDTPSVVIKSHGTGSWQTKTKVSTWCAYVMTSCLKFKDRHADLFLHCLSEFYKSTPWPHEGLSFITS